MVSLMSCGLGDDEDDDQIGNWIKRSDFEGVTRSGSIAFSVGDFAYVGLGSDGDDYLTDFWRYDPDLNFWQEMASFPGVGRVSAVAFSIDGKGYIGTGFNDDLDIEELADFWEYDPALNVWTQKADYMGGPRFGAVGFAIDGLGYIGTGYDGNYLKDFWTFDPVSNSWVQTVSLFGSKREQAVSFVIDGKAYVGSGRNNGAFVSDFWAFDPSSKVWVELSLDSDEDYYDEYIAAISRYGATSFSISGLGYIVAGISDNFLNSVYEFDPLSQRWEDVTPFEGSSRSDVVSFEVDDSFFMGTGRNGTRRFDDFYEFRPTEEYDEDD